MITTDKLIEKLEYLFKRSSDHYMYDCAIHDAIALVKKHCEGGGDEVLTLLRNFVEIMRGQKDANVNWIALVDLAKVARSLIDSDKPAEDPQKGCWSCKRHIAGRGCYKTCNPPVWEAWRPKPTAEVKDNDLSNKLGNINVRIHGLLTDRDNINKRLGALENDRGFQLRGLEKRIAKLEGRK